VKPGRRAAAAFFLADFALPCEPAVGPCPGDVEPAHQRAVRLIAQPEPCEFNCSGTKTPVSGLADPLLTFRAAAAVGRRNQPGVGAEGLAIRELAHESLAD
jgi:hypothetical protein